MSTENTGPETVSSPDERVEPRVVTWRSNAGNRMEQVRVSSTGQSLRALGHLIAAGIESDPGYTVAYEASVDDSGYIRRITLTTTSAAHIKHLVLTRNGEGSWLSENSSSVDQLAYAGIVDVELQGSCFFASLPIRREGLNALNGELTVRTLSIDPYTLEVGESELSFNSGPAGVHLFSPSMAATLQVDDEGFVITTPSTTLADSQ